MNLREHEDNQFTKEVNEVESYLLRIVQRYFDIENNYSKESVEAMINEALTRLKRDVLGEHGFLFSLNQKTGHILLSIHDFGGELAFEKQSAFNKDFGNSADTICQGNDFRLKNRRRPTAHVHDLSNMDILNEELNRLLLSDNPHIHDNIETLNMLKYSGAKTQIDLALVEHLDQVTSDYRNNLIYHKAELDDIQKRTMEELILYLFNTNRILLHAREIAANAGNWLKYGQEYVKNCIPDLKDDIRIQLLEFVHIDTATELKQLMQMIPHNITNGEFDIPQGNIICSSPIPGQTNVNERISITHTIPTGTLTGIQNKNIKLYFRYDLDGKVVDVPLPFVYSVERGKQICVTGHYTDDGEIVIESNFINTVPAYVTNADFYGNKIIFCNDASLNDFYDTTNKMKEMGCELCLIDSSAKNTFVENRTISGKTYWINGTRSFIDNIFYDSNHNPLSYFNWSTGSPDSTEEKMNITFLNGKWKNVECDQSYGYIAEYTFKRLAECFANPRIFYRALGTKEVI